MARTHITHHETATLRGGVYADLETGASVQTFKYGDKELDLSNGQTLLMLTSTFSHLLMKR